MLSSGNAASVAAVTLRGVCPVIFSSFFEECRIRL
jgi:hypothetical protein